jgi:uncharacterized protein (TIGR03437 family)
LDYAPAFYAMTTAAGSGTFFTPSNAPITAANPAAPGSVVTTYMVGLGATNPQLATGVEAVDPTPTVATPIVSVGGENVSIIYSGLAADAVGVYQVSFTVPPDVSPGSQSVVLQIGSRATPGSATLPTSAGAPGIRSITNGATFQVKDILHPMASNSFVSIFASNIGSTDTPQSIFPATSYQGLSVEFNGRASPLYYVFPSLGQINLVTPSDLGSSGTATVALVGASGSSQTLTLTLGVTDIGIFRLTDPSDASRENGAVLFANTSWDVIPSSMATALGLPSCAGQPLNASCGQPARSGDAIEIYFTGGGEATPGGNPSGTPLATGQLAPGMNTGLPSDLKVQRFRRRPNLISMSTRS